MANSVLSVSVEALVEGQYAMLIYRKDGKVIKATPWAKVWDMSLSDQEVLGSLGFEVSESGPFFYKGEG